MNEKELREKRDQIVEQMQAITDNATNVEKRTLTTEEQQKFAGLKKEVEDIDATLEAMAVQNPFTAGENTGEEGTG